MTTRLKQVLSDASLLYVAAIWGSTFIVVKDSLRNIDPIVMVGYRFLLAALFLLIFLIIKKKVFWKNLIPGIVLGILLWLIYIPQTVGLLYTTAANSVFITGLFVAFVPIFSL